MKLLMPALLLALTGCVPLSRDTHLVLGIGVFRVQHTNQVTVLRADTIGLHAGDRRLNLGLSQVMIADIPTNSNTILEIKR